MSSSYDDQLYAKSGFEQTDGQSGFKLHEHTCEVVRCAHVLFEVAGKSMLDAFGLNHEQWKERFRRDWLIAAWLHDLGKANDQFQAKIRKKGFGSQPVRHEAISYWIATQPEFAQWFKHVVDSPREMTLILWAVAGHHRKFKADSKIDESRGHAIHVYLGHKDFMRILRRFVRIYNASASSKMPDPPKLNSTVIKFAKDDWMRWMATQQNRFDDLRGTLSSEEKKYIALLKAAIINADVAGSIRVKNEKSVRSWMYPALNRDLDPDKLESVITRLLNGKDKREFQIQIAESKARVTLVKAGCGTGKTLGAYAWAAQRSPGRRLFFCYPTIGTSSEGFKNYLWDTIPEDSDLIHGLAEVEIAHLQSDEDALECGDQTDPALNETPQEQDIKDAIDTWATPIVCCTVDTVLGIMQNYRRGIYLWPSLAKSVFVFDEVHAFDDCLFAALLRFLQDLPGLPCLLMTASLPANRQKAIEKVLAAQSDHLGGPIEGPIEIEQLPRYKLHAYLQSTEPPWDEVEAAWRDGCKILWVVNSVNSAVKLYDDAKKRGNGISPILYHSRYRYLDRRQHHKKVVEEFSPEKAGPVLAITTQVAEMSLDLSADLLVTHRAPIPALIQRAGRLNRRGDRPPAPVIVYHSESAQPYETEPLELASRWLNEFSINTPISQRDLIAAWEKVETVGDSRNKSAPQMEWLDGLLKTECGQLRKATSNIDILSPEDAEALDNRQPGKRVEELRISTTIPTNFDWRKWRTVAFCKVPPKENFDYCPTIGVLWKT